MATGPLPRGTLTFLFTDIEGSTKLLNALGTDRYHQVLETHTETLRRAFTKGHEVRIEGDALFVVFATARDALEATAAGQRALAKTTFPHEAVVRVRMGMHTGEGTPASEKAGADYVGIDVHRAARIAAVAHGGQVLASAATRMLAGEDLPPGVAFRDLGEHRLKDLAQPERIFQLVIDGCPTDFPELRTLDRTPNNLPTQITTFIGREREIRDGLTLLDGTRLLTLTGPGGTGKTRLSLQLAAEAAASFPDGAFWVPLAPISDPELVPSTIAHSLGVQVSGNEQPIDRISEHVRGKRLLLVLDNFEQILPAATTVSTLLATGTELKVIASSRAPLRISGEQEYPIPPLELPDPARSSIETLAQSDAVRLFVERAHAVKPDFTVTAENAGAVAEICARLDGLPLAIELAAARVKLLTPQAMLPRLRQGLDLLASSSPDRTDRQRTLRGAIAWSYDLLDAGMQRLFARCAVFVAGAELEQIEAVCGPSSELGRDLLDGLSELVDQSLLRQNEIAGEPRFRMLVTIRDYAIERLAQLGEDGELRRRHLAAYLAFAERARPELQGKEQKRWLDRLELDHDNFRAALEFAISSGRADDASRIVYALWRFWQSRGHLPEGRSWAERGLALSGSSPTHRLRALEATGGLVYWMGDRDEMLRYYTAALDLARELDDDKEIALAAYNLSFAYTIPGRDMARGRALLEEALALFRELGETASVGRTSFALSNVLSHGAGHPREDLVLAQDLIAEALRVHRALSNQFDLVWDLHMGGLVGLKLDDPEAARQAWTEASGLLMDAGDMSGMVLMLSNFAELAKAGGDLERHDVLVGAWAALAERTGVGLTEIFGLTESREQPDTIPAERQPAVQRGLAMTLDDALAYALATEPTKTG